jgi:hypothetical protein
VVKNLASSFCKVDEKEVEKKRLKRSKVAAGESKAPGPSAPTQGGKDPKAILKKEKEVAKNAEVVDKEKEFGAAGGAAHGAKKRPSK